MSDDLRGGDAFLRQTADEQLVEHAIGAVGFDQPLDREQSAAVSAAIHKAPGPIAREQPRIGPDRERHQGRDQQEEGDRQPRRAAEAAANVACDERRDHVPSSSMRHSPGSA